MNKETTKKRYFVFNKQLFAAPFAVFMLFFVLLPLVMLFVYAFFKDWSFTLDGFKNFFTKGYQSVVLLRSIGIALLTAVICLLLGYPVAYILTLTKIKKASMILMLFIMPMWINTLLRTYATKQFLGIFVETYSLWTLLFGLVSDFLPFMILPIYTVLNNMDKSLIEAAQDLGASPFRVFTKTVLPLSVPGIMSGFLMVFTPTVSTFFMNEYLGTNNTRMFGQFINELFQERALNEGSALSLIVLFIVLLAVLATNRFTKIGNTKGGLW